MISTNKGYRLLALGLAGAMALGACTSQRDDSASKNSDSKSSTTQAGGSGAGFVIDTSKCESYDATQGVTDTEIKIGSSSPLSGLYATAFAVVNKGYAAYFDFVNAEGGVDGKQIKLISEDDAYDPSKSKTNVEKLIEQDNVFGIFNVIGTANNLSFRDDFNAVDSKCVPNLFAGTGSEKWGETEEYPWLIGSLPPYPIESATFVKYLETVKPDAKIGLLKQNDDFGDSYEKSLRKAIEGTGITIEKVESINAGDLDPTPQVTSLSTSGADALFIGITGLPCANALKAKGAIGGWDPVTYLSLTCTSQAILNMATDGGKNLAAVEGLIGTGYLMDPADPQFDDDPGMQQFKAEGAKHGLSEAELSNGYSAYGWLVGEMLVESLKSASAIERAPVMEAAYSFDKVALPLLREGITISTNGAADPFPIESLYVIKYDTSVQQWIVQGDLYDFEGKTLEYVG